MTSLDKIKIDDIMSSQEQCNATSTVREFAEVRARVTSVIGIIKIFYSVRGCDNACYFYKTCEGKLEAAVYKLNRKPTFGACPNYKFKANLTAAKAILLPNWKA